LTKTTPPFVLIETGLPAPLGPPSKLAQVLHEAHVDLVVFYPPLHHPDAAGELLSNCERLGVPAAFAVDALHRYPITPQVVVQAIIFTPISLAMTIYSSREGMLASFINFLFR
jgi:hypothetical protein